MKYPVIAMLAASVCLLTACHGADADHDEHAEENKKEAHTEDGEQEIVLHPEQARVFGLQVDTIQPAPFRDVLQVSGQIVPVATDQAVVTARSAGIVTWKDGLTAGSTVGKGQTLATITGRAVSGGDANEMARVQLRAAQREADRLKPLYDEGLVTGREYNVALQAVETARAAIGNNSPEGSTATSPISGVIEELLVGQGQYVEGGTPLAKVTSETRLTLRADVPERYAAFLPQIQSANFRTSASQEAVELSRFDGRMTGAPSQASAQGGYVPVYFTFGSTPLAIKGAYADVYLLGKYRDGVLAVPVGAVTEQQGANYIYIRHDEEGYYKRRVTLGATDGKNVEILTGLEPGEGVVTRGAAVVTMAEAAAAPVEGHHHHH